MRTVYTDKLGLFAWAMLFVAALSYWRAYESYLDSEGLALALLLAGGCTFLFLALKRFWQIRKAKAEGSDPSILSVKVHD